MREGGHAFLDRRLYLPTDWCEDKDRRGQARVPDAVTFKTRTELARDMLEAAFDSGVPMRWVTADEVYALPW